MALHYDTYLQWFVDMCGVFWCVSEIQLYYLKWEIAFPPVAVLFPAREKSMRYLKSLFLLVRKELLRSESALLIKCEKKCLN